MNTAGRTYLPELILPRSNEDAVHCEHGPPYTEARQDPQTQQNFQIWAKLVIEIDTPQDPYLCHHCRGIILHAKQFLTIRAHP
jgi:hypothetical protein